MIINLIKEEISKLPAATGVYFFKKDDQILYVGKAISIKARILSHLENSKLDPKESLIVQNSNKIEYVLTDSEFKALLLESSLIQKHLPKYNARWKDDKSYLYIKITTKDQFPKVFIVRKENDRKSVYFGPFPSRRDTEKILNTIRRLFPFCTQKQITPKPCFYSKIGLCDPCPNEILKLADQEKIKKLRQRYLYNIRQLKRILQGNVDLVLKESYKKLKEFSKQQNFEEAIYVRNNIQRFEQLIQQTQFSADITLHFNRSAESLDKLKNLLRHYFPNLTDLQRIECYDVSNLFQKDATASMVVFTGGMPDTSQYRRFKIKNVTAKSDFEMLEETFTRRFKNDWPEPDLLVVDGGTPQVLRVKQILANLKKNTFLIGIAKHPDRLVINAPKGLTTIRPSYNNLGFNLVRAIRDEAHRFARKYHLLLRHKKLML